MSTRLLAEWSQALELAHISITATIDPQGRLGPVGGLWPKLLAAATEAATLGLLRTVVVSSEQADIASELLSPDASPLRVIKAATLREAIEKLYADHGPRQAVRQYEREQGASIDLLGRMVPIEQYYQRLPLVREIKRERLPSPEQRRYAEQQADNEEDRARLNSVDILRWEEAVQEEQVFYEAVELTQLGGCSQYSWAGCEYSSTGRPQGMGPTLARSDDLSCRTARRPAPTPDGIGG